MVLNCDGSEGHDGRRRMALDTGRFYSIYLCSKRSKASVFFAFSLKAKSDGDLRLLLVCALKVANE